MVHGGEVIRVVFCKYGVVCSGVLALVVEGVEAGRGVVG